jgi:hypothetical protein
MSLDWDRGPTPLGMQYVRSSGNTTTYSVTFPVNDEGFFPLRCPQTPDHRFGVILSRSDEAPEPNTVVCPYCGYRTGTDAFYTSDEQRRTDDVAHYVADQLAAEAVQRLTRAFTNSRSLSVRSSWSPPAPMRTLHTYTPEPTQRTMTCGTCGEVYSVYGIALFCIACGKLSPAEQFAELLRAQKEALAHLDSLPPDSRSGLESSGVLTKIYEDTVKDAFGALETFLKQVFAAHVPGAEQILAKRGNVFQRLRDASEVCQQHLGFALNQFDPAGWQALLDSAEMRHVLTHNNGHVDARYMRMVPTTRLVVDQRIPVDRAAADAVLENAERLVNEVLAQFAVPSSGSAVG